MTNANRSRLSGVRKRVLLGLLLALAVGLVAFPAGVWAADAFTDVPEGNVHHDSVDAIADAGVTQGCAEGAYCPADAVRRDQMASFMDRLGALSEGQTPVVNAATAQQAENAEQAANSAGVGGVDAQELLDRIEALEDGGAEAAESGAAETDSELAARVDALESDLAAATDRIGTLESELSTANSRVDTLEGDLSTANSRIDSLEGTVANQAESITALDGRVSDLEADSGGGELESRVESLETTFSGVTREDRPVVPDDEESETRDTLVFEGMNLQLLNGHEDEATATANGLGNFVIGYNAQRPDNLLSDPATRTGSHNLVLGDENEWTSWGGIIAGVNNTISGQWSMVTAGEDNVASSEFAAVSGGHRNTAEAPYASVSGGRNAVASGDSSSVSGGNSNTASAADTSVSGGDSNTAGEGRSSISGGHLNTTGGWFASVSGGQNNTANGDFSSILGGQEQTVDTNYGMYPPAP